MEPTTTTTTPPTTPSVLEVLTTCKTALEDDRNRTSPENMGPWLQSSTIITVLRDTETMTTPEGARRLALQLAQAGQVILDIAGERDGLKETCASIRAFVAAQKVDTHVSLLSCVKNLASERDEAIEKLTLAPKLQVLTATGPVDAQSLIDQLTRERDAALASERILSQAFGRVAEIVRLPPTASEPPTIIRRVEALVAEVNSHASYLAKLGGRQNVDAARAAIQSVTTGTYLTGKPEDSFLCYAREAQGLITTLRSERGELELLLDGANIAPGPLPARVRSIISKVAALEGQIADAIGLMQAQAPIGSVCDMVQCLLGDLARITDHVADCHTLLTERGGPMKPLLERIRDILNDRDQRATRMGEIQGELDTALTIIVQAKKDLTTETDSHDGRVAIALRTLNRVGISVDPLTATIERQRLEIDNHVEAMRITMEQKRAVETRAETIGREWQRLLDRIHKAQGFLEAFMLRRGSMVEKAILALQGNDGPPDRARNPLLPICAFLWDDEPHHPTPAIRQDAIDAEDRRILASAGQPLNRQ